MTSGTERSSVGNYDKAIQNRNSSDGFYELAKNECLALQMEIISFSMMGLANMETQTSFEMLSGFLGNYANIYNGIQNSGMSGRAVRDPSQRDAMAASIRTLVINAQVALDSVSPEVLGDTLSLIHI